MARAGGRIERAILVGDTSADYGAAIAARIPLVSPITATAMSPISALTYGNIVDSPLNLHEAVMSFVGREHFLGADADSRHHSAAQYCPGASSLR